MPKMGEGYLPLLYIPDGAGRYVKCPVLTTTQRDALTGVEGMIIFNSTTDQLEQYDGSTWEAVGQPIMTTHEADIDKHMSDFYKSFTTSDTFLPWPMHTKSTAVLTADELYAMPFLVVRPMTISSLVVRITAADAGKSIRVGVYKAGTNLYPGDLLKDFGTASVASTGTVTISATLAITDLGVNFLAIVSDGAPTIRASFQASSPLGAKNTTGEDVWARWKVDFTYAALPDPFTASGAKQTSAAITLLPTLASLD